MYQLLVSSPSPEWRGSREVDNRANNRKNGVTLSPGVLYCATLPTLNVQLLLLLRGVIKLLDPTVRDTPREVKWHKRQGCGLFGEYFR
jgi:hypothetical protein